MHVYIYFKLHTNWRSKRQRKNKTLKGKGRNMLSRATLASVKYTNNLRVFRKYKNTMREKHIELVNMFYELTYLLK